MDTKKFEEFEYILAESEDISALLSGAVRLKDKLDSDVIEDIDESVNALNFSLEETIGSIEDISDELEKIKKIFSQYLYDCPIDDICSPSMMS